MEKKILVVDDEAAITKMVKRSLERTGKYIVHTENDGSNAINAAREFQPDLIFLDIMMPGMSGDSIARQLRNDKELYDVRYVFLTGIISKEDTDKLGTTLGGNEFLAKPVSADDLLATIERILGE